MMCMRAGWQAQQAHAKCGKMPRIYIRATYDRALSTECKVLYFSSLDINSSACVFVFVSGKFESVVNVEGAFLQRTFTSFLCCIK